VSNVKHQQRTDFVSNCSEWLWIKTAWGVRAAVGAFDATIFLRKSSVDANAGAL
jgi:hypothetical protein